MEQWKKEYVVDFGCGLESMGVTPKKLVRRTAATWNNLHRTRKGFTYLILVHIKARNKRSYPALYQTWNFGNGMTLS